MSTRAVYSFIDQNTKVHVYNHHDGYPSGAAQWIAGAKNQAWELPRFEADEFAASFVAFNKQDAGGIRLIAAAKSTPCNKAAKAFACDIEYRYEIRCLTGRKYITVTAFETRYWGDKIDETKIWSGNLDQMAEWANESEYA